MVPFIVALVSLYKYSSIDRAESPIRFEDLVTLCYKFWIDCKKVFFSQDIDAQCANKRAVPSLRASLTSYRSFHELTLTVRLLLHSSSV